MSCEKLGDDFRLLWDSDTTPVYDCGDTAGDTPIGFGDFLKPKWTEEVSLGDLGFDFAIEQVEIPLRISTKTYRPGRADWTLTFNANYNISGQFPEDSDPTTPASYFFDRLIEMIGTRGVIHLGIADGPLEHATPGDQSSASRYNVWHAWWSVTGNLGAALDTNASLDVECRVHHWRGANDDELPELRPRGYTQPA